MNTTRKNKERLKDAVRKNVNGLAPGIEKGSWVRASALLGTSACLRLPCGGAYLGTTWIALEGFSFSWT
jgi:hypothetical protein